MPDIRTRYLDRPTVERLVLRALRDQHGDDAIRRYPLESPITGKPYETLTGEEPAEFLAGVVAARQLASIATGLAVGYATKARGAGQSWLDIAATLRLESDDPAEAAFALFSEQIHGYGDAQVRWTCNGCGERITDRGPYGGHPADYEIGHASGCSRHAQEIRVYLADFTEDEE